MFIEKRSTEEIKVELQRKMTQFKLRAIPILKTLDLGFFIRLAFFGGIIYAFGNMAMRSNDVLMTVKEDPSNSPNKFSKTFG